MVSPLRRAPARPGAGRSPAGDLLRHWRVERRRSQMDLALDAGVSTRHLSYVETGRAHASPELLLALAEELEVPLRERNALLLAAGYAPAFTESDLDGAEAAVAREAVDRLLAGHEPYPAVVLDRRGDVVLTNRAIAPLLAGVAPALLTPPINVYRLSLHPDGLASRTRNRDEWAAHLGHRLARLARLTGDARLHTLLEEVRRYPGVAEALAAVRPGGRDALLLTLELDHPEGPLSLHSTVTTFGSPHDVTLAELAIESFFPADAASRALLNRLTPPEPEPETGTGR